MYRDQQTSLSAQLFKYAHPFIVRRSDDAVGNKQASILVVSEVVDHDARRHTKTLQLSDTYEYKLGKCLSGSLGATHYAALE